MQKLSLAGRYGLNLVSMVAKQRGHFAAMVVAVKFVVCEIDKFPKLILLTLLKSKHPYLVRIHPKSYSHRILDDLVRLGVEVEPYRIDTMAFHDHVAACSYPPNYAGGSLDKGGSREQKLLEYFVSLDLLDVRPTDVVIDVGSEWSIFPEILRRQSGATVYQQDMIYPPGVNGRYIGGSAAQMPIPDGFANKLVLHNAFEHFEGTADTDFIVEAWRVLTPGGKLCILPLNMAENYYVLSDPLVKRRNFVVDEGAALFELPWWHNRFGRYYDANALVRRVLSVAGGFSWTIYQIVNLKEIHANAHLYLALVMQKLK